MNLLKGAVGLVLALIGLVWLGQGIGLLPGSFMSGQALWAIVGIICLVAGGWLVLTACRLATSSGSRP